VAWLAQGSATAQTLGNDLINSFNTAPTRPLLVAKGETQAYAGLFSDVTSRQGGNAVFLPVGGGFGFTDAFEFGIDSGIMPAPFAYDTLVPRMRLYSRHRLLGEHVALQLGIWVPTVTTQHLGLEALLPLRFAAERTFGFGQAKAAWVPGADQLLKTSAAFSWVNQLAGA
jgi:hypothetical protein